MSESSLRRSTRIPTIVASARSAHSARSDNSLPSVHEGDVEDPPLNSVQDLAYDPLEEAHHFRTIGQPYTTPAKNSDKSRSISREVKVRLEEKALDPLKCAITHEKEPYITIQVCHVIPRAINLNLVERLQYHWNLEKYNVDTHENLIYLRVDMHLSFDNYDWALFPTLEMAKDIENSIYDTEMTKLYDKYAGKKNEYLFVPLSRSIASDITIHRRASPKGRNTANNVPKQYIPFEEPYPNIESHVHPFSVVWNAGQKLLKRNPSYTIPPNLRDIVSKIVFIYTQWCSPVPKEEPLLNPGTSSLGSSSSRRSDPRGSPQSQASKRPRSDLGPPQDGEDNPSSARGGVDTQGQKRRRVLGPPGLIASSSQSTSTTSLQELGNDELVRLPRDINDWVDGVACAAYDNKLASSILNDGEIGNYRLEKVASGVHFVNPSVDYEMD